MSHYKDEEVTSVSKYTTGETAKLCNITVRTVQFYDTKDLLKPSDLTEGGRRLYTDDDLTKLRLICTLKTIGLSLELIKNIVDSESPIKMLTLLLDEQIKRLDNEINERKKQLATIDVVKDSIHNKTTIPINTITDIARMVEKNKKVRSKFWTMAAIACVISLPPFGAIALWIINGMWMPLVILFPLSQLFAVLLSKHFYKNTAFICAECITVFTPPFKNVMLTSGTTKARWLTCTKCEHTGYCVETIANNTDNK